MQYIGEEKYYSDGRDFEIYIFRDNNNDELVLESYEIVNGNRKYPLISSHKVPMNGEWTLEPNEYPEYSEKLAAAKQSIIIYTTSQKHIPPGDKK